MDFGNPEHELALKRYIVAMLVREAQADGEFSTIEKKYLSYAAKELGLPEAEVNAIRLNPNAFDLPPNSSESERMPKPQTPNPLATSLNSKFKGV